MLMVMNAVTFHVQADDDTLDDIQFVCHLAHLYVLKAHGVIITGNPDTLQTISKMLWFFPAEAFLPHQLEAHALKLITPFEKKIMIKLNPETNQSIDTNAWVEPVFRHADAKKSARIRYKVYQQNKLTLSTVKEPCYG